MTIHCLFRITRSSIFLFASILFFASTNRTYSQQLGLPFTRYISSSDYNSGMMNSSIVQDHRGFMYFANNFGLMEFDGSKWNTYPVRYGSKVRDVAISKEGKIYVAAQGDFGFFTADETGHLTYNSLADSLTDESISLDEVWQVFVGKKEIYFCAENNIFVYSNDSLVESIPIAPTTNFYYLNNRLYLQFNGGGLYYLNNGQVEKQISIDKLNNIEVISVLRDKGNKYVLISANSGIYDQAGNKDKTLMNSSEALAETTINCAIRLKNGNVAIGTQNDGLFIFDDFGKRIIHLTKGSGLNYRVVLSILEDKQGNLWLGHDNGLTIVELSMPFSYINEDLQLPGSGYDAFSSGDELFLATNNGLFKGVLSDPSIKFQNISNSSGQAYSVSEFNGKILLGHHNGSFEISGTTAKEITSGVGSWTFLKSSPNSDKLIGGTYEGLQLFEFKNSSWVFAGEIKGFNESSRVMEYDNNGSIWMTHGYKGVYRLRLNSAQDSVTSVEYFGTEEGLPSNALINVYKIENELIFTTPNGPYIFDYKSNTFKLDSVLSQYEVINDPLNFLADDAKGNIYFLTQSNMGVLTKKLDGSYEPKINIFNKVHSMLNNDLVNISVLNSNNILFGAKEGFIVYNPSIENAFENNFGTYIRNVSITSDADSTIFGGNFKRGDNIIANQPDDQAPVLGYNNNSLKFTYSADFMDNFDKTEYQFFLEGFESNWSPWSSQIEKEYTNLFEGYYIFRVKAKNINNIESSETSYAFEILPPWYRSKLAYVAYLIIIATFITIAIVIIDRKYKESKRSFEKKKQLEVDEIDSKLKSVTQETTQKIEKLKSEKLQSEVELKNVELASSTMNLINKNEFISSIKSNLTSISKKSKSQEVIKELGKITHEIDKNISHDDDWKQFAFHFNKVHGNFTTRLTSEYHNLSAQDLRLCSYLRLNLSTKEIAQLLNISVRGVEISRYRLRKKLALNRSDNLSEFILNY